MVDSLASPLTIDWLETLPSIDGWRQELKDEQILKSYAKGWISITENSRREKALKISKLYYYELLLILIFENHNGVAGQKLSLNPNLFWFNFKD